MKTTTFVFCVFAFPAIAATPSTSCPSGYFAINEPYIAIATTCPSGMVSIGTANSCLVSNPTGDYCIMYAPAGVSYTDTTGTYEFTDVCAIE